MSVSPEAWQDAPDGLWTDEAEATEADCYTEQLADQILAELAQ
ncbi:hypothetical protein OG455_41370 [Kitasatospora sp. NBC_01287]|nr:hypothetical protein [Kitasatospora sp. NBC_01287]MCX4750934.1 hypothetical protein [Kitasatospora sp. NBC_01287]MCX4751815.1 hypothetical protein [Kitasatospora sp. NBC_01287]MCX4751893.1 hypothetical protein [Kitasatospora sp. NBC_01287]